MAVIQLTSGGMKAPAGALNIRLSRTQGLELVFVDADGNIVAPNFQVTHTEGVIVPTGPLTVSARTLDGRPFAAGTLLGVTVKAASGMGDEIVRAPSDVGGRQAVSLVEIADGQVTDLVGQASSVERGWMQRGNYAYHMHHKQGTGRTRQWAAVLDGSAIRHHQQGPGAYQGFLELVLGIAATGYGGAPESLLIATSPVREVSAALESEEIDWAMLLGHDPAPWPCLGEAIDVAQTKLPADGALLLIVDGVFVDYREVRDQLGGHPTTVLALGRSRFGARPSDKPEQFWEEELAALEGYDVVSVASFDGLDNEAFALADAMFPEGVA